MDNADAYSSDIFPTTFGIAHGDTFYSIPVDEYPNMVKVYHLTLGTHAQVLGTCVFVRLSKELCQSFSATLA